MDSRRLIANVLLSTLLLSVGAWQARADELVLKDGKKIVGNIVGYEHDMFRVETDFGIALVRKDKVVSIKMSNASGPSPARHDSKPPEAPAKPVTGAPEKSPATSSPENSPALSPPPKSFASATPAKSITPPVPSPPPLPPPPPASHPVDEPLPTHLEEHLEANNTYVNDTFRFAMFKPPTWKVYEGVPNETGSGIMAIGTDDEQTLLIVDRQVWSGPPNLKDDSVEARLRHSYQEFKKLSESPARCDGHAAIRRTFTGVIDGAEWHGVAVHVEQGNTVFSIIGLTSAESFEFQQAVLNKIINSFHFVGSKSGSPGQPAVGLKQ